MSKPASPSPRRVRTGILVSVSASASKREKPSSPPPKPANTTPVVDSHVPAEQPGPIVPGRIPWFWLEIAGSVVCVLVIFSVALYAIGQTRSQSVQPQVAVAVEAVPIVVHKPAALVVETKAETIVVAAAKPAGLGPPVEIRTEPKPPRKLIPEEAMLQTVKAMRKDITTNAYANTEEIGSDILFMKNAVKAFERGREDDKMVFMVHLSGNFEDKDCT